MGEGSREVFPEGSSADFFLSFFEGLFSNAFPEGRQNEIFQFSFGFGVPGGGVF